MNTAKHKLKDISFVKKVWTRYRLHTILRKHQRVGTLWTGLIDRYFDGQIPTDIPQVKRVVPEKVIWQYWGQGAQPANMPEVVDICMRSVQQWKGEHTIILLSDQTVKDYIDFPDFVWEKLQSDIFNRTFFSDLLRLALLRTYGGIWMDATILLSGPIGNPLLENDYFLYQRKSDERHQDYWSSSYAYYWGWHPKFKVRMLSSVIFARKESVMIAALYDLMLHYWESQNSVIDYFFFQILYEQLVSGRLAGHRCKVVSDVLPHLLQTKINCRSDAACFGDVLAKTNIHKLTYFDGTGIQILKGIIRKGETI